MSIEVHIDWQGTTHLVGRLYTVERSPAVTFEYDREWLARADTFSIDPTGLPLGNRPIHGAALFGAMQDCGPDRWGRILVERAVRKQVLDRKPYRDIDYVLALDDTARIGALRFRTEPAGPFLAATTGKLPPVVSLAALIRATDAIHGETETAADLRFLLGAGSPLGGARPKAAVMLADRRLAMAKFPKPDDVRDIAAGEVLALHLARQAGINVAEGQLITAGGRNVSVITRFDRDGARRLPFLSAHSLLGLPAGETGAYTLLADGIRQFGHDVTADLQELWRRLVFSLLASNYDDHLRNHGFLMRTPGKWSLSPAYDLNPVPEIERAQIPKTAISEDQPPPTIEAALQTAPRFGLKTTTAKAIVAEVHAAVADWRKTAKKLRLPSRTLETYATAFDHPLMQEAARHRGTPR
jgi:serine/threonine-protein kinase HipA